MLVVLVFGFHWKKLKFVGGTHEIDKSGMYGLCTSSCTESTFGCTDQIGLKAFKVE